MSVRGLNVWLRVQAVAWLPLLLALLAPTAPQAAMAWRGPAIGLLAASYASLVLVLRAGRRPADVATIARGIGLIALAWNGFGPLGWGWWCAAVAVVLGDLVDGWLARRYGGSDAGAVLDMETDQATVLTLAVLVVLHGGGPQALLLPALKYLFVLAMSLVGAPAHEPKPLDGDNTRGRRICAAVVVSLLLALLPGLPPLVGELATATAAALLLWSFSSDARHLLQTLLARKVRA